MSEAGYFDRIQRIVRSIPRGKVATYGQVASAAGCPGTARQVAWALQGAAAKGIPWQRVLGSGGKILLRGEAGLHQRLLLELEGVGFSGDRVPMKLYGFCFSKPARDGSRGGKKKPGIAESANPDT